MKLNLGCGKDAKEGDEWVNIDIKEYEGVDKVYDLNDLPYPFDENSVSEIRALDILEHLDDVVAQMEEWYRICEAGAKIKVRVPHYKSPTAYADPTHEHFFTPHSFDYFIKGTELHENYPKFSNARFDIDVELVWTRWLKKILPFFYPIDIIFHLRVLKKEELRPPTSLDNMKERWGWEDTLGPRR